MNTSHKTLMGALPVIAAFVGGKLGVKVVVGNHSPCTDGKTIYLPNIAPDDDGLMAKAIGFIDHEAGHVRYTDIPDEKNPVIFHLWNVIEDYRIEKAVCLDFPGARKNLIDLCHSLEKSGQWIGVDQDTPPPALFTTHISNVLYHRAYGGNGNDLFEGHLNRSEALFIPLFGMPVFTRLTALLGTVDQLKSSADAHTLAKDILEMLEQEKEKERENSPQDSQDTQGNEGDEDAQDDQPDQGTQGNEGGEDAQDDQPDQGTQGDGANEDNDRSPTEAALRKVIEASIDDLPEDMIEAIKRDLNEGASYAPSIQQANLAACSRNAHAESLSASATAALRSRIAGLMQSSNRTRSETRRHGRTLDTRKLHRVAVGDDRVFLRKSEQLSPNTAIQILVDNSGSMVLNGRYVVASKAALATLMAIESVPGTSTQVGAFPNENDGVTVLTPFGKTSRQTSGAYGFTPSGTTPMAEAMLWSAVELLQRKEKRKILMILTDGEPNYTVPVKDLADRYEGSGIEVFCIGIQTDAGKSIFKNFKKITYLTDLAPAMIGMLQTALLRQVH